LCPFLFDSGAQPAIFQIPSWIWCHEVLFQVFNGEGCDRFGVVSHGMVHLCPEEVVGDIHGKKTIGGRKKVLGSF
jgi:hypothetical protein